MCIILLAANTNYLYCFTSGQHELCVLFYMYEHIDYNEESGEKQ